MSKARYSRVSQGSLEAYHGPEGALYARYVPGLGICYSPRPGLTGADEGDDGGDDNRSRRTPSSEEREECGHPRQPYPECSGRLGGCQGEETAQGRGT